METQLDKLVWRPTHDLYHKLKSVENPNVDVDIVNIVRNGITNIITSESLLSGVYKSCYRHE